MPSIIRDSKQEAALKEIEKGLETVKVINSMSEATDSSFQLSMIPAKGRPIHIDVEESAKSGFLALAEKMKSKLVKDIRSKAAKFSIAFSEEEEAILNGSDTPKKTNKNKGKPIKE